MSETLTHNAARDDAMSEAAILRDRPATDENVWRRRLVLFVRVMAVLSIIEGLYHWAQITGFVGSEDEAFDNQPIAWQAATIYFAVIELVAAVGLWLAATWGEVVWMTSVFSMVVIEGMFPSIYGGSFIVVALEVALLVGFGALVWMAAHERPS